MKHWLLWVCSACIVVLFPSFICRQNISASASNQPIDGPFWKLRTIQVPKEVLQVPDHISITARFRDGTIDGSSGCNRYKGYFTQEDNYLECKGLSNALQECGDTNTWETRYLDILRYAEYYSAKNDSLIIVCGDAGTLVYQKKNK